MCEERKISRAYVTPGRSSRALSCVYFPSIFAGFILFRRDGAESSGMEVGGVDADEDVDESDMLLLFDEKTVGGESDLLVGEGMAAKRIRADEENDQMDRVFSGYHDL